MTASGQYTWTRIKRPNPHVEVVPGTGGRGWATSLLACRALEVRAAPCFAIFGCASLVSGTVPQSGFEPMPLQGTRRNLTAGLRGNSCPIARLPARKDKPSPGGPERPSLSPQHRGGY